MSTPHRTRRTWTRVRTCPVPGVELCIDGSFRIGSRRFSPRAGLSNYIVDGVSVDKEPGDDRPLVLASAQGRVFLLYRDGLWYQSEDGIALPRATPTSPSLGSEAEQLPLEFVAAPGCPAAAPSVSTAPAVDLPFLEPGAVEAAAEPQSPGTRPWWLALLAPFLLVVVALITSVLALFAPVVAQCSFDEQTWLAGRAYHTLLTHAFLHTSAVELAYFAGGILLFGWLVQRNVGLVRTLLLFCFCAASSVGMWQFAKTPLGQDLIIHFAGKVFELVWDKCGLATGLTAWRAYVRAWDHMLSLKGPVWGAGGALAGLMTFAVCRRRFQDGRVDVRRALLLLALGYLAVGGFVRVHGVSAIPFILYLGGALGGMFFVIPDKFLHQLQDFAKDKLKDLASERLKGSEK